MKIYNVNLKNIFFPLVIVLFLLASLLCLFLINSNTITMTSENFSTILKECHDAPYKYKNKKIKMVGYIFRVNDFTTKQFVIARDMVINESESRIIGFLCESENAHEFQDNEWVCATGTIYVGNYHGAMPIVKIKKLEPCKVPEQIWVYPPLDFINYQIGHLTDVPHVRC